MEENIKVIENIIYNDQGKKMSYVDVDYAEGEKFINAIENLIKGYKELEELLEEKTIRVGFENKEDYIPKSKVRAEIHDIDNWLDNGRYFSYGLDPHKLTAQKEILEKLLQEGDDK